ncbi:MAG TPA: hypothetical protein PKA33_03365 [Amaricoccus sp.]|mgnify:CR=1 FL=1|uniref:hypothetical protein n=1 Tax=Amaricoccus sp. TaxID=1872485 RepID=UPI002B914DEF|nr:hypothetical protein [Amaricoccus sp.]HMQ92218.1 hypothetical protein [Amaricoccus sp.]HMR12195.1 hypothetical protein [Arachnia sp.]HMR51674.1 hypothetical protein [Amaricoccus sp.]HMT98390.1 hypothetical protein [Amaricoccus sp.]
MRTKFAKTFTTWFYPVDDAYLACLRDWVDFLRRDQLFGPADALFPKPLMGLQDSSFAAVGLSHDTWRPPIIAQTAGSRRVSDGMRIR